MFYGFVEVDLVHSVCVDVDLIHSGSGMYCQFFLFTIGSIIEWDVAISTSAVYRVSKTSSIVEWGVLESWGIFGSH